VLGSGISKKNTIHQPGGGGGGGGRWGIDLINYFSSTREKIGTKARGPGAWGHGALFLMGGGGGGKKPHNGHRGTFGTQGTVK